MRQVNKMSESKRLYFGNQEKRVNIKPMPKGQRLCFGEAQPVPAENPMLHPGAIVLAYGNSPQNPQYDVPFKVVDGTPVFAEKPKK